MTDVQKMAKENIIVKHYAGSIAYGTNLPTSDIDFRGIFHADPVNSRTPFFPVTECKDHTEEDTKLYELTNFLQLCVDCNPNIIETLHVDMSDVVVTSPAYQMLRDNRQQLLSRKVAFTTSGYAMAQLKRIKGHDKWLTNPQPKQPPQQIGFISLVQDFTKQKVFKVDSEFMEKHRDDHRLVPYGNDIYGMYEAVGYQMFSDDRTLNTLFDDNSRDQLGVPLRIVKYNKEEYNRAKEKHKNYWTWKANRNAARSKLEEEFGYDSKHAMHLVRLLRMGEEILTTGQVIVKRPDAQELLAIRNGAWTYEQLIEYAEYTDNRIQNELYHTSSLPKHPDLKFAAKLLMEVQDLVWQQKNK